jgi:hypothetical protein
MNCGRRSHPRPLPMLGDQDGFFVFLEGANDAAKAFRK